MDVYGMGWTREANPALVTASRFSDMQAVQLNATSRAAPVKLGPPARLLHRRSHAMTESFNNARPSRSQSSSRGSAQASGQYGGVRRYATGTIRALLPDVETLVVTQIFRDNRFLLFALKGRWILAGGGTAGN